MDLYKMLAAAVMELVRDGHDKSLKEALKTVELECYLIALKKSGFNKCKAARSLGMSRSAFRERLNAASGIKKSVERL